MLRSIFSLRTFGFFLYVIALLALLLYVRFPSDKFTRYLEHVVGETVPGYECQIGRLGFRFPDTFHLSRIRFSNKQGDQEFILAEVDFQLELSDYHKLFQDFSVALDGYGGLATAALRLSYSDKSFTLGNIQATGFDLKQISSTLGSTEREIIGTLAFTGEYSGPLSKPLTGTGSAILSFEKIQFGLVQPILSLPALDFDRMSMNLALKEEQQGRVLDISDGQFTGPQLNGTLYGSISFVQDGSNNLDNALALTGTMQPTETFLRDHRQEERIIARLKQRLKMSEIPYTVGGTIDRPTFRYGR